MNTYCIQYRKQDSVRDPWEIYCGVYNAHSPGEAIYDFNKTHGTMFAQITLITRL